MYLQKSRTRPAMLPTPCPKACKRSVACTAATHQARANEGALPYAAAVVVRLHYCCACSIPRLLRRLAALLHFNPANAACFCHSLCLCILVTCGTSLAQSRLSCLLARGRETGAAGLCIGSTLFLLLTCLAGCTAGLLPDRLVDGAESQLLFLL